MLKLLFMWPAVAFSLLVYSAKINFWLWSFKSSIDKQMDLKDGVWPNGTVSKANYWVGLCFGFLVFLES